MKQFITSVGYLAALSTLLYLLFLVSEPTNKQVISAIFSATVIIVISIQRDEYLNPKDKETE